MRTPYPARRRAEEFEALLVGARTQPAPAELAPLLELVGRVQAVAPVAPRAEFAASLRERLMAEAPAALAGVPADDAAARLTVGRRSAAHDPGRAPSRKSRERRIGIAIAAFSLVGASTASAVASQGALPGDTLYPVKRLIEDTRTSLAMGQDAKEHVLLSQARTRLAEARELGTRDDADPADIEQALKDYGSTAHHASTIILADYADHGDRESVDQLRAFTEQGVDSLSALTALLPPSVDDAIADVTDTLLEIDGSAAAACPDCDSAGITELPSDLLALLSASTGTTSDTAATATPPRTSTTTPRTARPRHAGSAGPSAAPTGSPLGQLSHTLTDPLTHGGGGSTAGKPAPGGAPTGGAGGVVGGVGGAVGGAVGGVGGTVGGLGDSVGGPVGGVLGDVGDGVGDLGDTVGGTTGQLGGTLDGVLGGVLGGTPTPKP